MPFKEKKILIGITGGIAAYKILTLIRLLKKSGANIQVILTESAKKFITPLSIEALTHNKVRDSLFDSDAELSMSHIELAKWADLFIIAPATANTIAKIAHGIADDLLTTIVLATKAKIVISPAMNQEMFNNKITQQNLDSLKNRNICIIGPDNGEQACGDIGEGRFIEPEILYNSLLQSSKNTVKLNNNKQINNRIPQEDLTETLNSINIDPVILEQLKPYREILKDKNILITAGPTREQIDPVRYITNHSSGRMGILLALVADELGANVTLILGHVQLKVNDERIRVIMIESAAQMHNVVMESLNDIDIFIGCAAVADFRVKNISTTKIKKQDGTDSYSLELIKNPDILYDVANSDKRRPIVVAGFAAETDNIEENVIKKLKRKNCDIIFANDVSKPLQGFNSRNNQILVYNKHGKKDLGYNSKEIIAQQIFVEIGKTLEENIDSNKVSYL